MRALVPLLRPAGFILIATLLAVQSAAAQTIQPDPSVQREIASVAAASSPRELKGPLAALRRLAGDDYTSLVPQLVYFSMQSTDVNQGMAPAVVIRELEITRDQQWRGVVPYLGTTDPRLNKELRNYLGNLDDASASHPPDFSRYLDLLRRVKSHPPTVLIQHMYETAPDQALEVMADVYITNTARHTEVLQARGTRDPAELERLSTNSLWWVRLYVASRLQQDPSLRSPALLERLQHDSNPLVQAAIAAK